MTTLESDTLRRIARDHAVREAGLRHFIGAVAVKSLRRVRNAIRLGADWVRSLFDVWRGNEALDLPAPAKVLSRAMAESHERGIWRAKRLVGVYGEQGHAEALVDFYRPRAIEAAESSAETIRGKVEAGLDHVFADDRIIADLAAASEGFAKAGYTPEHPFGIERAAAALVLGPYSAGMGDGYNDPSVLVRIKGLRHLSTLDGGTTEICRQRHRLSLPVDDPYWLTNWVQLHWGCRSVIVPLLNDFEPSVAYPTEPPKPGFGAMPVVGWMRELAWV